MSDITHSEAIAQILQKEFGTEPGKITRMSNGICNEVYLSRPAPASSRRG